MSGAVPARATAASSARGVTALSVALTILGGSMLLASATRCAPPAGTSGAVPARVTATSLPVRTAPGQRRIAAGGVPSGHSALNGRAERPTLTPEQQRLVTEKAQARQVEAGQADAASAP